MKYVPGKLGEIMAKKKNKPTSTFEQTNVSLGTLGDLLVEKGFESNSPQDEKKELANVHTPAELSSCSKIIVRKEKKGRGGKVVTTIEGTGFSITDLEHLAKKMRKTLGCGGGVENSRIVLQGDIGERVRIWLKKNGAKTVV